jgi:hypothetical protein
MLCCAVQADRNEEEDMLIYNWVPRYTGRRETRQEEQDFQQTYVFDGVEKRKHSSSAVGAASGLLQKWLTWA